MAQVKYPLPRVVRWLSIVAGAVYTCTHITAQTKKKTFPLVTAIPAVPVVGIWKAKESVNYSLLQHVPIQNTNCLSLDEWIRKVCVCLFNGIQLSLKQWSPVVCRNIKNFRTLCGVKSTRLRMANTLSNLCIKISVTLVEVQNREGIRGRGTLGMQVLRPTRSHTLKTIDFPLAATSCPHLFTS